MSNPPSAIKGDRTNVVVAVKGEGTARRWMVKQIWGADDETPALIQFDAQRRIHQVEVGQQFTIDFDPPAPSDWPNAKLNETQTFETKLKIVGMEIPLKYQVKRLKDETVSVPAGEFKDCRHLEVLLAGVDAQGQPSKTRFEYWFSRNETGLIKEVTVSEFGTDRSQTSTSVLKAHNRP